jgi:hypothetical protein
VARGTRAVRQALLAIGQRRPTHGAPTSLPRNSLANKGRGKGKRCRGRPRGLRRSPEREVDVPPLATRAAVPSSMPVPSTVDAVQVGGKDNPVPKPRQVVGNPVPKPQSTSESSPSGIAVAAVRSDHFSVGVRPSSAGMLRAVPRSTASKPVVIPGTDEHRSGGAGVDTFSPHPPGQVVALEESNASDVEGELQSEDEEMYLPSGNVSFLDPLDAVRVEGCDIMVYSDSEPDEWAGSVVKFDVEAAKAAMMRWVPPWAASGPIGFALASQHLVQPVHGGAFYNGQERTCNSRIRADA